MKVTSNDIFEAKLHLPLFLLFWIPQTFMVILSVYIDIKWFVFGNTEGINKWYTDRFSSLHEAYFWIAKDIGIIGCLMILILVIGYLWMSKNIFIALFYNYK